MEYILFLTSKGADIMKRKILAIVASVLAIILAFTIGICVIGRRPFKNMNAEEVQSISIHLWPPNETMELSQQEIRELVGLLQQVKIYNPSWLHLASGGQSNIMTITYQDGSVEKVNQFGSTLIINGMGYRAEYEPNEAINQFANILFDTGF